MLNIHQNLIKNQHKIEARPYLMKNPIQHYAWGTRGKDAFIPQLLGMTVTDDTPYAELWMGAHPTAPSQLHCQDALTPLDELISHYPEQILGAEVASKFSNKLPFLFKVLSAGEALSIQAHPNKQQAAVLHRKDPHHYRDDNHKPEIAIALTELTALIGFKSVLKLNQVFRKYPELRLYLGPAIVNKIYEAKSRSINEQNSIVLDMYSILMKKSLSDEKLLAATISNLASRLARKMESLSAEEGLFLDLYVKYQIDVGLLSLFILNAIHLKEGQGIYIKAGIPHAYLYGNIVECMANSDNVIRAGLTPKFKDIDALIETLTPEIESVKIIKGRRRNNEFVYETPTQEFRVSRLDLTTENQITVITRNRPEIWLVLKGKAILTWNMNSQRQEFTQGQAIFIPACLNQFSAQSVPSSTIYRVQVP